MLITAIEERKKGMSALFIDGEYAVSIDTVTLISSGKRTGSEITDEELYDLIELSKLNRAKEKAMYLLEYRQRSSREIEEKLLPLYGEKATEAAVERLTDLGLINDESFARDYARNLLEVKRFSGKRVLYEMMKKGIDKELAEEIIEEYDADPVEQIIEVINRKYLRSLNDEKGRKRIISGLRNMGYGWEDIKEAFYELDIEL